MICINSVAVYPSSATITKGQWYYGAWASISSDCPECAEVKWYSNNSSIASVNETTGYIYGVSTGTTRVYAEATDGSGKKDYITVTVAAPISATGVSVCPTSLTMNVGDTDYLCETVYPPNTTNQTVTWCSSDDSIVCVDYYTGEIYANDVGTAVITATTVDGGFTSCSTVTVCSTDPFHHSNVEYVRIKKWRSVKTNGYGQYIECNMSTTATKSYIDNLTYFTVFFPDEDEITTFEINDTLINKLNEIEGVYQSQFFKQGRPLCFHKGKEYADGFVSEGKIE